MLIEQIEQIQKVKALVLGDFMLDEYIIGDVRRISPEAPVPVIEVKSQNIRLGGAGNVINNILSLGAKARVLTCLGDDKLAESLLEQLTDTGAETQFIQKSKEVSTIIKTRVVSKNQQFLRYDREVVKDHPQSYQQYVKENIEKIFDGIDVVLISDYGKGAVTENFAQLLISFARSKKIPVVVDPKGSNYEKYSGATICTPNMNELSLVSGKTLVEEQQIERAGLELCSKIKLDYLLVTRSEKGMSLIGSASKTKIDFPATAKEVVDVTGAGDTVITVISLGVAAGLPLTVCCKLANRAASVVISKFGSATTTFNELIGNEIYASGNKLIPVEQVKYLVNYIREQGKRIVFTNGCFDILHAGHISSFEQARRFGDVLIVGLNSDASVRRIKGEQRPIVCEQDRARLLCSLSLTDYVIIFDDDTPQKLIEMISPDVLIKGKDWEENQPVAGQRFIESNGGRVCFIDLEQGLSTTNIIKKIRDVYSEE